MPPEYQDPGDKNPPKKPVLDDRPFFIAVSITQPKCFGECLGPSLKIIGCDYYYAETPNTMTYAKSLNTIVQTHREELEHSKYLLIISQDETIEGEGWGEKLKQELDQFPDLGYAGCECKYLATNGHWKTRYWKESSMEVLNCDASVIIILAKLFLERQFDETFEHIYGFPEEYACYVRFKKNLTVYHVPIPGLWTGDRKCSEEKKIKHPVDHGDHMKLKEKYNLDYMATTGFGGEPPIPYAKTVVLTCPKCNAQTKKGIDAYIISKKNEFTFACENCGEILKYERDQK